MGTTSRRTWPDNMAKRIYTSKDKIKVLAEANKMKQAKVSLWKDPDGFWHAAQGPSNVPNWAVEVEHVR